MQFRQSLRDFPCSVELGRKKPDWKINRWNGSGLRFVPPDDEGFTLRGGKRRLVYKGRRRSHRFTILGDTAFEYDCILEKEPEKNVISLRMEGAENFDFFRQPDFVKEPFLKGSYAVYKKETFIGEGTGKLCHIHRPEIIDARGRKCWGSLSIAGSELHITIPENWLSEAKYPVIVDPTIGTTTIGSQYLWDADPPEPWSPLYYESSMPVNRFLVPETINGLCSAYFYTNIDDGAAGGYPVIYSDNGDKPQFRKSINENFIDLRIRNGNTAGWRSGTFNSNGNISSGSYIWFGLCCEYSWYPRFDYGAKIYYDERVDFDYIPNTYPLFSVNSFQNFKLSMYFTYTSSQNHVRTLTQGVELADNLKLTGDYKRSLTQTAEVNTLLSKSKIILQKIQELVKVLDKNNLLNIFQRTLTENIFNADTVKHFRIYSRVLTDKAEVESLVKNGKVLVTKIVDTVHAAGAVFRGLILTVCILTKVFVRDYVLQRFLKAKTEITLKSCVVREIVLESRIN